MTAPEDRPEYLFWCPRHERWGATTAVVVGANGNLWCPWCFEAGVRTDVRILKARKPER